MTARWPLLVLLDTEILAEVVLHYVFRISLTSSLFKELHLLYHPIIEQVIRFLHIQLFDCFLNKAVSVTVSLLKGGHLQHICAKWFAKKQKWIRELSMLSSISNKCTTTWYESWYLKDPLNIGWKFICLTNKNSFQSVISRKVEYMLNRDFLNTPSFAQIYKLVCKHIYFIKSLILVQYVN